QRDAAAVERALAADQIEQGRFAGAVAADQPHLPAIGNLRRRVLDQRPPGNAIGDARDGEHGARPSTARTLVTEVAKVEFTSLRAKRSNPVCFNHWIASSG